MQRNFLVFNWIIAAFIGLLVSNVSYGSYRIPIDSFFNRYQLSSDIVYGEVASIEKTKESLPIFDEFSGEENYRAKFVIKHSWKGQKEGEVYFYFNNDKLSYWFWTSARLRKKAKQLSHVAEKRRFLLFLREEGGKKIAQNFFGAYSFPEENQWQKVPEVEALNALGVGKPMIDVLPSLGGREVKDYQDSLKNRFDAFLTLLIEPLFAFFSLISYLNPIASG